MVKIVHHVEKRSVKCIVVTISDTRTLETDKSGKLIEALLVDNGHQCIAREIVQDEMKEIEAVIDRAATNPEVEAILMSGGTGIAPRDVTIEVVQEKLDKEIPGFGELFRMLSYTEDIGAAAIMSRAIAGIVNGKVIFSMPGSSGAVKLAMNKLILKELSHFIQELNK